MLARLAALFGVSLWGAVAGWAVALAAARPGEPPDTVLGLYGTATCFGAGYLLGSLARGRAPQRLAVRAAATAGAVALAAKLLVPALAAWTVLLVAAATCGVLTGLARTAR